MPDLRAPFTNEVTAGAPPESGSRSVGRPAPRVRRPLSPLPRGSPPGPRVEWWAASPLLVIGVCALALAVYAFLVNARLGWNHFPMWVYLAALGGIALIGGATSTIVGEPLEELPVAGDKISEELIAVPVSEWAELQEAADARRQEHRLSSAGKAASPRLPEPLRPPAVVSSPRQEIWSEDVETTRLPAPRSSVPTHGMKSRPPRTPAPAPSAPGDDVSEIIQLLEKAIPQKRAKPVPAVTAAVRAGPSTPELCLHCRIAIPKDRPWLRCESCGGGLCLDGIVEAAEAGEPGLCPSCRALLGTAAES